jgi:hypothetical protein
VSERASYALGGDSAGSACDLGAASGGALCSNQRQGQPGEFHRHMAHPPGKAAWPAAHQNDVVAKEQCLPVVLEVALLRWPAVRVRGCWASSCTTRGR